MAGISPELFFPRNHNEWKHSTFYHTMKTKSDLALPIELSNGTLTTIFVFTRKISLVNEMTLFCVLLQIKNTTKSELVNKYQMSCPINYLK